MFLSVATGFFDESSSSKGTLGGLSADLTELSSQLSTQGTGCVILACFKILVSKN